MCTPNSHLPALVMLNQAEKDNEAFYLDATDFIFSSRFATLCLRGSHSLGARFLSYRRRKVDGEQKIEENQKKCGIHKRGSVVEAYSRQALQLFVSQEPTLVAVSWSKAPVTNKKLQSNFAKNRKNHRRIVIRGVIIKQVMLEDEGSSCVELSVSGRCAPLTVLT